MSIAVEDWDDLAEAPRRSGRRGRDAEHVPSPEPEPVLVPGPAPAASPVREQTAAPVAGRVPEPSIRPARPAARPASPMRRRIIATGGPTAAPPPLVDDWDEIVGAPRAEPAPPAPPEPTLGVADFADDHYGDTSENLRLPAGIAGANALFWLVGRVLGVVELTGVAFFVSIGLLFAAYVLREWQRNRTSLICLAGAFPLPLTIISLFV